MNKERGAWLLPEGQKVWVEGREVPIVEEYKNQRQLLRECREVLQWINSSNWEHSDAKRLVSEIDDQLEDEDE
jgi:hypothetical protein